MMSTSTLKLPSAWLPIAMSLTALAIVIAHFALFGTASEPDEGTAAHLFQLLIAGQVPIVAFFAIKWLPRNSRTGLPVLALQIGAILAALAPVYYLHL